MKTRFVAALSLFILTPLTLAAQTNGSEYFGQTPPGDTAVIFEPNILSAGDVDHHKGGVVFSPDGKECYYTVWGKNFSSAKIYYTQLRRDGWSTPVEAPFSAGYYASGTSFSKDGNKLFFCRKKLGEKNKIWMVQRTAQGWGEAQKLPSPINSDSLCWDSGYSETHDGTGYFCSIRPGGLGRADIWRTRQMPGQPLQVENLDTIVNTSSSEYGSLIAPDGSFLIFSSERPGGFGNSDLYVTFQRGNGTWTKAMTLERNGAGINVKDTGSCDPSLSPDGRFLFFTIGGQVHWISTKIIAEIKKEVFHTETVK